MSLPTFYKYKIQFSRIIAEINTISMLTHDIDLNKPDGTSSIKELDLGIEKVISKDEYKENIDLVLHASSSWTVRKQTAVPKTVSEEEKKQCMLYVRIKLRDLQRSIQNFLITSVKISEEEAYIRLSRKFLEEVNGEIERYFDDSKDGSEGNGGSNRDDVPTTSKQYETDDLDTQMVPERKKATSEDEEGEPKTKKLKDD